MKIKLLLMIITILIIAVSSTAQVNDSSCLLTRIRADDGDTTNNIFKIRLVNRGYKATTGFFTYG